MMTLAENGAVGRGAILEEDSFELHLRATLPRLLQYARSLVRDPDAAQDLVQEASMRAWRARARFEAGTNFKAWCYRILRNCFLSDMRRRRIARIESCGDDLPDVSVAPDQEIALDLKDVWSKWPQLSPDQQRSLTLVAIDGLSYEEAAAVDGVPLGTMKSRVARARHTLLELMEGVDRPSPIVADEPRGPSRPEIDGSATPRRSPLDPVDRAQIEMLRQWRSSRAVPAVPMAA
jgi:RNA polymerase sigma-70 factor (ECF subfamily)